VSEGAGVEPAGGGDVYREHGFVRVRSLVPPELCLFLTRYLLTMLSAGRLEADTQVEGSGSVYGDPAFDTLLDMVRPAAARLLGIDLLPTYSFARLYVPGCELTPHTDRGSCEHSVTVHLGADEDEPWPIWLRDRAGVDRAVGLGPGDGLFYLGRELTHWRTPYTGRFHAQVFLHYVDAAGTEKDNLFDGRSALGTRR
jgi:hypothetical protein